MKHNDDCPYGIYAKHMFDESIESQKICDDIEAQYPDPVNSAPPCTCNKVDGELINLNAQQSNLQNR